MFRIGEFARFTRVSAETLRHYEGLGILEPSTVDPDSAERYYSVDQLPRLNRIILLRELGYPLEDIGELLDHEELDDVYARRERLLRDAVSRAQAQLRAVRARRELIRDSATPAEVTVRAVEPLLVATVDGPAGGEVGALFSVLESYVREQGARSGRPPLTLLPEPDEDTVTVAVPVNFPVPPAEGIQSRLLDPVPRMACAVHRAGQGGLPALLQRMLRWLALAGERPGGPIREVYLRPDPELGLPRRYLWDDPSDPATELQVPLTG